jgi:hypothetical protein
MRPILVESVPGKAKQLYRHCNAGKSGVVQRTESRLSSKIEAFVTRARFADEAAYLTENDPELPMTDSRREAGYFREYHLGVEWGLQAGMQSVLEARAKSTAGHGGRDQTILQVRDTGRRGLLTRHTADSSPALLKSAHGTFSADG